MTWAQRLAKLAAKLADSKLNAVALNPGPTLTYLTGLHFHLMDRRVVLIVPATGLQHALVLPELELPKVANLDYELRAFPYGENPADWPQVFRNAMQACDLYGRTIGVEPRSMRVLELRLVEKGAPGAHISSAEDTRL